MRKWLWGWIGGGRHSKPGTCLRLAIITNPSMLHYIRRGHSWVRFADYCKMRNCVHLFIQWVTVVMFMYTFNCSYLRMCCWPLCTGRSAEIYLFTKLYSSNEGRVMTTLLMDVDGEWRWSTTNNLFIESRFVAPVCLCLTSFSSCRHLILFQRAICMLEFMWRFAPTFMPLCRCSSYSWKRKKSKAELHKLDACSPEDSIVAEGSTMLVD